MQAPNNSLQVTFDPPPIFATAKTGVAPPTAPEIRCWVEFDTSLTTVVIWLYAKDALS